MRNLFFKHNLLWILILIIPVIGLLTLVASLIIFFQSSFNNHTFAGDSKYIHYPGLNAHTFQSHHYQQYVEALISKELRLRNSFIRVNSQLYYSLFKKSFAQDSQLIVGENNMLFEMGYITAYCHQHEMPYNELSQLNNLKELSDYFTSRGKTFIYVITPSKAEYMPNAIPKRFHCQDVGISAHINTIKQLLDARHVRYIDGPSLMVEATQKYGTPMFPQGGTHWNWLGSTVCTSAIIHRINEDKRFELPILKFNYVMGKVDPDDSDNDLLSIAKLPKRGLYPGLIL